MHHACQFASDNQSGVCPEAWAALAEANADHEISYGEDSWTPRAIALIRELFETDCDVFFVFNGTAANALALAQLCRPHHSILCHEAAHIVTDECAAPEFFSGGSKLLPLSGANGKLDPATIERGTHGGHGVHVSKPRAVSITQATELGTVYSVDELKAISALCRRLDLRLHMDGARLANAVVTLGVAPRELTWQAGVDVLSFGATKDGGMMGEAVVFFNRDLAHEFDYRRKQSGQLAAKMRFVAAPWVGLLKEGAWLRHARHANAMAQRLADEFARAGVPAIFPRQANGLFVKLPPRVVEGLNARGWHFYFMGGENGWRLMCSWDTTEQDIEDFVRDLKALL